MGSRTLKQIAELNTLSIPQLEERWRKLFGTAHPPAHQRRFMVKRLAYRIQELVYGGLSDDVRRRAAEIAQDAGLDEEASIPGRGGHSRRRPDRPVPGTRLARLWNGRRYEVTVTAACVRAAPRLRPW